MSSRSRKVRKYDEEFKRRAVQLYLTGAKSCETLSEELGVLTQTLYGWTKQPRYANAQISTSPSPNENDE